MTEREWDVPVIFDVTAKTQDEANKALVAILDDADLMNHGKDIDGQLESWWTVERTAKKYDYNDNEHGLVVFQHDLDFLYRVLLRVGEEMPAIRDLQTIFRLVDYFDPENR